MGGFGEPGQFLWYQLGVETFQPGILLDFFRRDSTEAAFSGHTYLDSDWPSHSTHYPLDFARSSLFLVFNRPIALYLLWTSLKF